MLHAPLGVLAGLFALSLLIVGPVPGAQGGAQSPLAFSFEMTVAPDSQ